MFLHSVKELKKALETDNSWEELKENLKQNVREQLDGVSTPQAAMDLATEIRIIDKFFMRIEELCSKI